MGQDPYFPARPLRPLCRARSPLPAFRHRRPPDHPLRRPMAAVARSLRQLELRFQALRPVVRTWYPDAEHLIIDSAVVRAPMPPCVDLRYGRGVPCLPAGYYPTVLDVVVLHLIPPPVAGVNCPLEPAFTTQSDRRLNRHQPLERWFIHEPPYRVSGRAGPLRCHIGTWGFRGSWGTASYEMGHLEHEGWRAGWLVRGGRDMVGEARPG